MPEKKDPFLKEVHWKPNTIDKLEVEIGPFIETTGDFTRKTAPKARYWKAPVIFKMDGHQTNCIKIGSCGVPAMDTDNPESKYGVGYVYSSLNRSIGNLILKAAEAQKLKLRLTDNRIVENDEEWWVTMNNIEHRVGTFDRVGTFEEEFLYDMFRATDYGFIMNFDTIFHIKISTSDGSDRPPNGYYALSAECKRGSMVNEGFGTGKDKRKIPPPLLKSVSKARPAAPADVASEEFRDRLRQLRIRADEDKDA